MNTTDIFSISAAIIGSVGGSALIIFGLSSWLGKVWAGRILEKDKAAYKSEIEILKGQLNVKIHEYNVAASRIDIQRSEAIKSLFNLLIIWFEIVLNIRAPNNNFKNDKVNAIAQYRQWGKELDIAAVNFTKLSMKISIFLKPETYTLITNCGMSLATLSSNFNHLIFNSRETDPEELFKVIENARTELEAEYSSAFEPAREALIIEFRSIIDPTTLIKIS